MGKNQDPGSGINIPDPQHCSSVFDIGKISVGKKKRLQDF
jgi:hypothetical protein